MNMIGIGIIHSLLIDQIAVRLPGHRVSLCEDVWTVARYWILGNVIFVIVRSTHAGHDAESLALYALNVESLDDLYPAREVYSASPMSAAATRSLIDLMGRNIFAALGRGTVDREFPQYHEQLEIWLDKAQAERRLDP